MEVIRDLAEFPSPEKSCVATIGVYDGVHRGHQKILTMVRDDAAELGLRSAIVTFHPHPASLLRPGSAPQLLTGLEHKLEVLEESGIDIAVVVEFDSARASDSAETFVESVLVDGANVSKIVVGSDFHFGKARSGNIDTLKTLGNRHKFDVESVDLLTDLEGPTEPISSTVIRRALAGGDVGTAADLLGRHHEVRGLVVDGDKRGRELGFPTANIAAASELAVPADAVYAGWYVRDSQKIPCAINVGKRPTFYEHAEHSSLEAHLLDFDGDLYGEHARVQFVELLRSEQRFDGVQALKDQLEIDIQQTRAALS